MAETITDRYPHLTSYVLIGSEGSMRLAINRRDEHPEFLQALARVNEGRPGIGQDVSLIKFEEAPDFMVEQCEDEGWENAMVVHFIDRGDI